MPITKRGVYHNLKESKYVVSNRDITFFFSSEHTLNKFMERHENYRNMFRRKTIVLNTTLNLDILADIEYYRICEKRGFYVWLKGVSITWEDLNHYALRKMGEKESPIWYRGKRPKVGERFG